MCTPSVLWFKSALQGQECTSPRVGTPLVHLADMSTSEGNFVYHRRTRGGRFESDIVYDKRGQAGLGQRYVLVHQQLGKRRATYTFQERNGHPALVRFEVAADDGAEVTSRAVRELYTDEAHDFARRQIVNARRDVPAAIMGYEIAEALEEPRRVEAVGKSVLSGLFKTLPAWL